MQFCNTCVIIKKFKYLSKNPTLLHYVFLTTYYFETFVLFLIIYIILFKTTPLKVYMKIRKARCLNSHQNPIDKKLGKNGVVCF